MHRCLTSLAFSVLLGATALACASPAPTGRPASTCAQVEDDINDMVWSPGGQYLGVVTWDGKHDPRAWLVGADGRLAAETLTIPRLELTSLAVGPDGRRAWITSGLDDLSQTLVEDRLLGRRETTLDRLGFVSSIAWTRTGYAIAAGGRVVVLNPDTPGATPVELHRGDANLGLQWIAPDGSAILLTAPRDDGSGSRFEVIDPAGVHELDPAGFDGNGASMFGTTVIYHSIGGEMAALSLGRPTSPRSLGPTLTRRGIVSDTGILATESWTEPGRICFEDIRAKLG